MIGLKRLRYKNKRSHHVCVDRRQTHGRWCLIVITHSVHQQHSTASKETWVGPGNEAIQYYSLSCLPPRYKLFLCPFSQTSPFMLQLDSPVSLKRVISSNNYIAPLTFQLSSAKQWLQEKFTCLSECILGLQDAQTRRCLQISEMFKLAHAPHK